MSATLSRPRYGPIAQVVMTVMLLAGAVFMGSMAVLVSHDSALECQGLTACQHVERYPLGIVNTSTLGPIERAEARWSPGGRAAALKLVVRHSDGTSSEYKGVGKNGERAEDTADAINAYLAGEGGTASFALREGSVPVAIFLALLAVGLLVLAPHFFTRVRLRREGRGFEISIGRWPAMPHRIEVPGGQAVAVGFDESIVNGNRFFMMWIEVAEAQRIQLGISVRSAEAAAREHETFSAFFHGQGDTDRR